MTTFYRIAISAIFCSICGIAHALPVLTGWDLTGAGAVTQNVNGALFTTPPPIDLVTGTGAWKPFVRIQNTDPHSPTDCSPSSKQTCEQGYNTSDPLQFDEKSGIWTHDLLFSAVPIVTVNNIQYLEFALDIAEPAAENDNQSKNLLSLDQLQLFVSENDIDTTNAYTPASGNGTLGSLTALYSLDNANFDNFLLLDYSKVGSGNGRADMVALIPLSVVPANLQVPGSSVYLFSRFGDQVAPREAIAEGSFEEWANIPGSATCPAGNTNPRCNPPDVPPAGVVPEPQSLALVGLAMLLLARTRRRRVS